MQEVRELRYDGQVLACLIASEGSFPETVRDRYRKEFPSGGVEAILNYQSRQQKFLGMPQEKWEEEFHRLVRKIQFSETERQFLAVKMIPDSVELAALLPQEHHEMVRQATGLLERQQHTNLETTADKIAIAAKYAIENLGLVSPFIDEMDETEVFERSRQAQELAKKLEGGLERVIPTGIRVPPPVGIMLGTEGESPPLGGLPEEAGPGPSER